MDITQLLALVIENGASDLHLSAGLPPLIRVDGDLCKLDLPMLNHQGVLEILHNIMSHVQFHEYACNQELDLAFEIEGLSRFRVNVFQQSRGASAVFRVIPYKIPTLDDLYLPPVLTSLMSYSKGLILITGPSGSGKSTTLAAMLDFRNSNYPSHIITIEDPIEFIHHSHKSLVSQREVHRDTCSFGTALRSALREDPDVILVGELRDLETIRLALTAAETGHLVLGTLHTSSATSTIHRMIDVFPGDEKNLARTMLAESLQAVVAQTLLKKIGRGRIPALEIMICNPAIRNLIRENKITQIYSAIQTGQAQGMMTFEQHLAQLLQKNVITKEEAETLKTR